MTLYLIASVADKTIKDAETEHGKGRGDSPANKFCFHLLCSFLIAVIVVNFGCFYTLELSCCCWFGIIFC